MTYVIRFWQHSKNKFNVEWWNYIKKIIWKKKWKKKLELTRQTHDLCYESETTCKFVNSMFKDKEKKTLTEKKFK
jgi:hypothetical protein